jgi:hypothetical protein
MSLIQFESVVEGGIIRIPEEYLGTIHSGTKVMVFPQYIPEDSIIPTAKAGTLSLNDFTELKIDPKMEKFLALHFISIFQLQLKLSF